MRLSLGPTCGWGSDAGGIWSRIVVSRKYFVGSVLTFCKSFWYLLTFFFFMYLILFFFKDMVPFLFLLLYQSVQVCFSDLIFLDSSPFFAFSQHIFVFSLLLFRLLAIRHCWPCMRRPRNALWEFADLSV